MKRTLATALFLAVFSLLNAQPGGEKKLSDAEQAKWDAVQKILAKPDKLELYSLDPAADAKKRDDAGKFRGWVSLGKTALDGDNRKKTVDVVLTSKTGFGAKCFEPRHGIRAVAGDKTVDIVICFECSWIYIFTEKNGDALRLTINGDRQEILDAILTAAKVPLPKQAK